jgi:hypothetical protein
LVEDANDPEFEDNESGDKLFERYEKRYKELKERKKKLVSKLLLCIDKEVKDSLMTSPEYQNAYDAFDLLTIWRLTEQVVMGRRAISVYTLITRILKHRQEGTYNTYEKEFRDSVLDLKDDHKHFVHFGIKSGAVQELLTPIYCRREWPAWRDLAGELHTYAEQTSRMTELRKDNNDGIVKAHLTRTRESDSKESTRVCWNCGSRLT